MFNAGTVVLPLLLSPNALCCINVNFYFCCSVRRLDVKNLLLIMLPPPPKIKKKLTSLAAQEELFSPFVELFFCHLNLAQTM